MFQVEQDKRIRCQAPGCNHTVFRAIHLVSKDGRFFLYGSSCCRKLFGWTSQDRVAGYTTGERKLSDEERMQLESNTQELLDKLLAEKEALQAAQLAKLQSLKKTFSARAQTALPNRTTPRSGLFNLVLDPEVERQAKEAVRARYGVDADLPGWRGLVLDEAKKLSQ